MKMRKVHEYLAIIKVYNKDGSFSHDMEVKFNDYSIRWPAEEEAELIAEEYGYDRYGQYGVVHSVKMIGVKEM